MIELGKKAEFTAATPFALFLSIQPPERVGHRRPEKVPTLSDGWKLVCGYDQGLGERLFVCENVADAQELYDAYARGGALDIHWYAVNAQSPPKD